MEPVSPFGPVAELKPKKLLQFIVDVSEFVVICPGTAKLFVVVTVLVIPFTTVEVTLPVISM